MPTNAGNSVNIKSSGIVKFDGTASFSAVTVTQYDVLVGSTSNGITSVGPGSAGQILMSGGASANPLYSTATYPSTAGTSGNVLTSNGTNWVSSAASAGSNILMVSGTLTSSQIKNLHGTKVDVIAAPGAGKVIFPLWCVTTTNYGGTNAFVASAGQTIAYWAVGAANTQIMSTGIAGSELQDTVSRIDNSTSSDVRGDYSLFENLKISLYNSTVTEISGNAANNNTITYILYYIIATLP